MNLTLETSDSETKENQKLNIRFIFVNMDHSQIILKDLKTKLLIIQLKEMLFLLPDNNN